MNQQVYEDLDNDALFSDSSFMLFSPGRNLKDERDGYRVQDQSTQKHTQLKRNDLLECNYKDNQSVNDNTDKPFTNQDLSNAFAMSNSLFENYQSQTNELESNLDMAVGTQLFSTFINNMADQINTDPEVRARIYNVNQFHSNYKVGET